MSDLWYALQVRPRFEKSIYSQLSDKGYESFLPKSVIRRKWTNRTRNLYLPMFPGYVFCRFNIHARLPILMTPGVNYVVGMGKTALPIDDAEIAAIRLLVQAGVETQAWPYVAVGDTVEVEEGPLAGLTGIVVRQKNLDRLIVSISLLMRSVSVEIDKSAIRLVRSMKSVEGKSALPVMTERQNAISEFTVVRS